jgi:hypothetical protein
MALFKGMRYSFDCHLVAKILLANTVIYLVIGTQHSDKKIPPYGCCPQCAHRPQVEGNNHTLNLESTSVLDTELHPFRRKVKEALHIKARRPSLNRDSGIELPSVYDLILN